jgi:hypothetical protein
LGESILFWAACFDRSEARAAAAPRAVRQVSLGMSIDKESSGLPEVNVRHASTKVNLGMIAAIVLLFTVATAIAFWVSQRP